MLRSRTKTTAVLRKDSNVPDRFPPCIGCGAEYAEGSIGTVHKPDCPELNAAPEVECLRCGCMIRRGQSRAKIPTYHPTLPGYAIFETEIRQHATDGECLIALRRKEVERG